MNIVCIAQEAQFVTLGIDREIFAVPVQAVLEILDARPVVRLPEAPAYVAGLIDVRGRGVPVIDLRIRLGLTAAAPTEHTRILVLQIEVGGRSIVLGLMADRVFEVMSFDLNRLEAPPDIGVPWCSDYIRGVARRGQDFVVVFDLAKLFTSQAVLLDQGTAAATISASLRSSTQPAGQAQGHP